MFQGSFRRFFKLSDVLSFGNWAIRRFYKTNFYLVIIQKNRLTAFLEDLGMERFERFRFSVPAVPLRRGSLCVSVQLHREDGSGFGSWKTDPVPRSVPAKTVPTVPVAGSSSVPGPP